MYEPLFDVRLGVLKLGVLLNANPPVATTEAFADNVVIVVVAECDKRNMTSGSYTHTRMYNFPRGPLIVLIYMGPVPFLGTMILLQMKYGQSPIRNSETLVSAKPPNLFKPRYVHGRVCV